MRRKEETGSIIEMCPVRNVIARFGNKWALLTVLTIGESQKSLKLPSFCSYMVDFCSSDLLFLF